MTLNFQTRKEDILAFTREYCANSPTFQRTRNRVRFMLPVLMLGLWLLTTALIGFRLSYTILCSGMALVWYFLYPARFDRRVQRYSEKALDEESYAKSLGPCELTLSETGLHSKTNMGEGTSYWSAVERVVLTDTHLFLFLPGPMGFPIPIAEVGLDAANVAHDFAQAKKSAAEQPSHPSLDAS